MDPIILLFVVGYSVCVFRIIYGKMTPKLARIFHNKTASAIRTYQKHKKTDGKDHRSKDHRPEEQEDLEMIERIKSHFHKKRILDYLENHRVPIHAKTDYLTTSEIYAPNLRAGGLYKNFDFEFNTNNFQVFLERSTREIV